MVLEYSRSWGAPVREWMRTAGLTRKDVRVLDKKGSQVDPFFSPPGPGRFPLRFVRVRGGEQEGPTFEVCLERGQGMSKPERWGFNWSEEELEKGRLVVASISPGSPIEARNLMMRSAKRPEEIVSVGARIKAVCGEVSADAMRRRLRAEDVVLLVVARPPEGPPEGRQASTRSAAEVFVDGLARARAEKRQSRPPGAADEAGEVAEAAEVYELELERDPAGAKGAAGWGFRFKEGSLVVSAVTEGSPADRWSLRCASLRNERLRVRAGDRLVAANEAAQGAAAQQLLDVLKAARRVSLRMERGRRSAEEGLASDGGAGDEEARSPPPQGARRLAAEAARCLEALPEALREVFASPVPEVPGDAPVGLADCLRCFAEPETLEDGCESIYDCAACRSSGAPRTLASKRSWLWPPLPPLLVVHLKRFHFCVTDARKLGRRVELPARLDLGDFVMSEELHGRLSPHLLAEAGPRPLPADAALLRYELYGVCVHLGQTMREGHYIAFMNTGPSLAEEEWRAFDDARVWRCTRSEALAAQAYVAFYRRSGGP